MTRAPLWAAAAVFACGAVAVLGSVFADSGGEPKAPASTPTAAAKIVPSLAARLPNLPADEPVRLIATLQPGVPTELVRDEVERLGGQLIQRFELIDAVVVLLPRQSVLPFAELAQIRQLEPADSGEPPPNSPPS
jgi:hypothetical protein